MNPITTAMERLRSNRYTPDFCGYEARQADLDTIEQGLGRQPVAPQPPAEAQAQGGGEVWQPMATAPKNGAGILALLPESNFPVGVRYHDGGWHVAWDGSRLGEFDQPHKWMQIPDEDARTAPPSAPVGVADLIERLEKHAAAWPGVYASDRQNVALLREAATALAQQPAAVDDAICSLPALWRQREDNGEERTEFDKGYEQASDECAEALERALAQQPAAVDEESVVVPRWFMEKLAKDTRYLGMPEMSAAIRRVALAGQQPAAVQVERDSDGNIVRVTQGGKVIAATTYAGGGQPAAVDDAMVERALDAVYPPTFKRNAALRDTWRTGLTAALAAQQGGATDA